MGGLGEASCCNSGSLLTCKESWRRKHIDFGSRKRAGCGNVLPTLPKKEKLAKKKKRKGCEKWHACVRAYVCACVCQE